jgi:ABC-type oligopeptide transport system substrate-binding subunit
MLKLTWLLVVVFTAAAFSGLADAQTIYQGPGTYSSYGNLTYWPGGTQSRYGNQTHTEGGETYSTYGNLTYGSNGTVVQRYGNQRYISGPDGQTRTCTTYGNQTYCD